MPMSPRLLRPRTASTAFDPRSIATLAAWYDASDASSLFQNGNGTTAVSALNDPVGRWSDKSGNGLHLTQSTNSQRPLYRPADQNGRGVLRMNILSINTMACSWNVQLNAGNTVFAVVVPRFAVPLNRFCPVVRWIATNPNALQYQASSLSSPAASANRLEAFIVAGGNAFRSTPSVAPTEGQLIVLSSVVSASSIALFRNGGEWGAATSYTGAISSTTSETLRLNADSNISSAMGDYDYCEILIYSSALTSARAAVERYLCAKWGATFSG